MCCGLAQAHGGELIVPAVRDTRALVLHIELELLLEIHEQRHGAVLRLDPNVGVLGADVAARLRQEAVEMLLQDEDGFFELRSGRLDARRLWWLMKDLVAAAEQSTYFGPR